MTKLIGSQLQIEMPEENQLEPTQSKTCNTCVHRQRWECNSKVFQYCGARKSSRTNNGLLKIKCKDKACEIYKEQ